MEQSILTSTKKVLHIAVDDPSFDLDIITLINSAFSTLHDLGVGPEAGFVIEDASAEWGDFIAVADEDDDSKVQQSQAKTFVLLTVRLIFDPPSSAFALEASERQLKEVTVRIHMRREGKMWTPPVEDLSDVIDGGDAEG